MSSICLHTLAMDGPCFGPDHIWAIAQLCADPQRHDLRVEPTYYATLSGGSAFDESMFLSSR